MYYRVLAHLRTHKITPPYHHGENIMDNIPDKFVGNIFLRPEEAILKIWQKFVFNEF